MPATPVRDSGLLWLRPAGGSPSRFGCARLGAHATSARFTVQIVPSGESPPGCGGRQFDEPMRSDACRIDSGILSAYPCVARGSEARVWRHTSRTTGIWGSPTTANASFRWKRRTGTRNTSFSRFRSRLGRVFPPSRFRVARLVELRFPPHPSTCGGAPRIRGCAARRWRCLPGW